MRVFIKFILLLATAAVMCFCYKFVVIDGGVKTVLGETSRNFGNYSVTKQLEVISDAEKIYTYEAFGKRFFIIQTDKYGLVMRTEDKNQSVSELVEVIESLNIVQSVSVPHWGYFLAAAIIIIIFPKFRKKEKDK